MPRSLTRWVLWGILAGLLAIPQPLLQAQRGGDLPISTAYAGTHLHLVAANHPWLNALLPLLPDFQAASGIDVSLETYFESQLSELLPGLLASGEVDAFMFRPAQEARLLWQAGLVSDLEGLATADSAWNLADWQPGAYDALLVDGGHRTGIPIVVERQVLYYRADLLAEAGLPVPATLDALRTTAAALHDPANGLYGIVLRGEASAAVTQFSGFLYSFGGDWLNADGTSAIASPQAIAAYRAYGHLLRDYGPPNAETMSWPQASTLFKQGHAALYIDADVLQATILDPASSAVTGKVGFAPFPAGPAGSRPYRTTTWALGISADTPNPAAVWEFVRWATSPRIVAQIQIESGIVGARQSVMARPDSLSGLPADLAAVLVDPAAATVPVDRPLVLAVGTARSLVGAPIEAAIRGEDVPAAAATASAAFDALLQAEAAATLPLHPNSP